MWVKICNRAQKAMKKQKNLTDCQVSIKYYTVPTVCLNAINLILMLGRVQFTLLMENK